MLEVLPGGAPSRAGHSDGKCFRLACDRYCLSLKRSRCHGKMGQRVKPQAVVHRGFLQLWDARTSPCRHTESVQFPFLCHYTSQLCSSDRWFPGCLFSHPTAPQSLVGHPLVLVGASSLGSTLAEEETFGCKSCIDKFPCKAE